MEEKYSHIDTDYLKIAQTIQDRLKESTDKYRSTEDDNLLPSIYNDLLELSYMIFNNYSVYKPESRDWICNRLASEIIIKLKKSKYEVYSYFKYMRLSIRHVRDRYIKEVESKDNASSITTCEIIDEIDSMNKNDNSSSIIEDNEYYTTLIHSCYKNSLNQLAEFLDLDRKSFDFYRVFIRMKFSDKDNHVKKVFLEFLKDNIMKEVKKIGK